MITEHNKVTLKSVMPRGAKKNPSIAARNREIVYLWQRGEYTQAELAKRYNLSRSLIATILSETGASSAVRAESENVAAIIAAIQTKSKQVLGKRLSLASLGRMVGVTEKTLVQWKKGHNAPMPPALIRLKAILNDLEKESQNPA